MGGTQHSWDFEKKDETHGPGCLSRHVTHYAESNPCSHRGQAHKKALEQGGSGPQNRYSWPAVVPGPPAPGAWDMGVKGNFQRRSRLPWWHEAHHVVPNSELRNAIAWVGDESPAAGQITAKIAEGLRGEGYNLNDKINMVLLPVDRRASEVLGLPLHRKTPSHRSHPAYSAHVMSRLKKVFASMKPSAEACDAPPEYQNVRKSIEALSQDLHRQILASHAPNLDGVPLRAVPAAPRPGGRP